MKEQKQNLKKTLVLLLSFLIVFSMMPSMAFADTGDGTEAEAEKSCKVTITSQANQKFFHAPLVNTQVDADLAETYGYADSVKDEVSVLDALVKAHMEKYGEEFTKETAADKLEIDENGNVTRYFGEKTTDSGVMINRQLCETPAVTAIKEGDCLEFFRYASAEKKDMYTGVSASYATSGNNGIHWKPVYTLSRLRDVPFDIHCWGFNVAQFGAKEESQRMLNGVGMEGLQLGVIDSNGEVAPVGGAAASSKAVVKNVTLNQTEDSCWLTAYNPKADIIMPFINVQLLNAPSLKVLELYRSEEDFSERKNPLTMTPALQDGKKDGYEVDIPDYLGNKGVYIYSSFSSDPQAPTNEFAGEALNKTVRGESGMISGNRSKLYQGCFHVRYKGSMGIVAQYSIKANLNATLKELAVEGIMDKAFNQDETQYHTYIDKDAETTKIKATGYNKSYMIKANGIEVSNGEESEIPVKWDESGRMNVEITVSSDRYAETIYQICYEKEPETDVPTVVEQPKSADYIQGNKAAALTAKASASGAVRYQWYKNSINSTEGATAIEGAQDREYTPSTEEIGTTYYYCQFTNEKNKENTAISNIIKIVVSADPTPKATLENFGNELGDDYSYAFHKGFVYAPGAEAEKISVKLENPVEGAVYSYQWYRNFATAGAESKTGGSFGPKDVTEIQPFTDAKYADDLGSYWSCEITCTFKGKKYESYATTGEKNAAGKDITGVYVFIKVDSAAKPVFTKQPKGNESLRVGDAASKGRVSVSVKKDDYGKLTYQWYVNTENKNEGGTPIEGATKSWYNAPTDKDGTFYYYCVAANLLQGHVSETASDVAKFVVKDMQKVVDEKFEEAGIKGAGTKEDPYQIESAAQMKAVQELVNIGYAFKDKYLSLEKDITLPADWKPMGVTKDGKNDIQNGVNLYPFSGKLDGKNHQITVPEGGLPLLGYVQEAEVSNLKIYGSRIEGYGLVNNFEGVGLSGSAIVIDNVTLVEGTKTLKSGLLGANITTNGFAGCTAGFVATIKNCIIEKDVVIGYAEDQSNIGAFAGRLQGTVENCVNHGTVKGKNYVGGIVGSRDNAMGACVVKNCTFDGTVIASGNQAGGIIGGGYVNETAPNGKRIYVEGNVSSGTVTGKNYVGGIMGADYYVNQNWETGTFKLNKFTGTVSATEENAYVGGVIGYLTSLNKYDNIAGNYYAGDCGAEKGIGFVQYVDTSCKTHETESGATYVDTSVEKPNISGFTKPNHNRTDDPLGADAVRLTYSDDQKEPIVIDLKISGEYKTEYFVGETFSFNGMTITATYHTGETKELKPSDVKVENFNSSRRGSQEVKLVYEGVSAVINVTVMNPAGSDITVSVKILGDTLHGEAGDTHTLSQNNLSVWLDTKTISVSNNATVWDALQKAVEGTDISFTIPSGNYISAVTKGSLTLAEMDNGRNSGWMYTINGKHPEFGVSEQYLENGNVIVLHYTDDYTREEDASKWEPPVVDPENPGDTDIDDPDTPLDPGTEAVKGLVSKIKLTARSARTSKKNVKVTVKADKATTEAIKELKEMGYTVKYTYFRSTKKASGYKSILTKSAKTYTNTIGKKGQMYYYKAQLRVYDKDGKLVAKTALKQCKYANRIWKK
ncbi:DUF4430 domain-containing protein [Anaerotruncus sp. 80]|uniref:DUF4430 domain-containing protein n=2 Tax=Oscillospiraceae TaxID=216572 RepID=A0A845QKR9_9FIRM|nr:MULTISPECIES: bacterial Ig-like domain-containing protein [Anaerotruncus]NBH61655.1 DUF4430 domain-containing protein [Anaerotruncus colihominis]NCF02310.1 DUF4430 domain-containing protein [Anaerotruncus sp. 80]